MSHKGHGYGKIQLQEAINRISEKGTNKVFVSTKIDLIPAQKMYESVGFYRLDNSSLAQWQIDEGMDVYYRLDLNK